jgi:hypothetical protein
MYYVISPPSLLEPFQLSALPRTSVHSRVKKLGMDKFVITFWYVLEIN